MSIDSIKASLPDYAKDLRLNIESVLGEGGAPGLTDKQIRSIALASAIASRNTRVTAALREHASGALDDAERAGAEAAAAMMAMTNVYYRFTHLVSDQGYANMRASLRMNVMASPGIPKVDFELCSLAVSAINGCGACIDSHEKTVRQHGVSAQGVQSAIRIASVVHAVAVTAEQAAG